MRRGVRELVDRPADQLKAEPARFALRKRQAYVDCRCAADVVWLDVEVRETHLDTIPAAIERKLDVLQVPAVVLHEVGEDLLDAEVEDQALRVGHLFVLVEAAGEPEDLVERVEGALKTLADQDGGSANRRINTIVTSSACAAVPPNSRAPASTRATSSFIDRS